MFHKKFFVLWIVLLFLFSLSFAAALPFEKKFDKDLWKRVSDFKVLKQKNLKVSGVVIEPSERVLFNVSDKTKLWEIESIVGRNGGKNVKVYDIGNVIVADIPLSKIEAIVGRNAVGFVSGNKKVFAVLDKSVPAIGAPSAWAQGFDGNGIKVAVIDTGIDSIHSIFQGKVVEKANFTDSITVEDVYGHGTHVAGIIAGNGSLKGVAPNALLLNAKVLNDRGEGSIETVVAGINWAIQKGANVVNLSLGAPTNDVDSPINQAIKDAVAQNVVVVVSAGNCGKACPSSNCNGYIGVTTPGNSPEAITVGAVNRDKTLACFSSSGIASPESQWFNSNYASSKKITITGDHNAINDSIVATMVFDTQSEISAGRMQSDCGDFRIVYNNSIELQREIFYCNTPNTAIRFKYPAGYSLNANVDDANSFALYFNNPNASTPSTIDLVQIYGVKHFDNFDGVNGLDCNTNIWETYAPNGSVSIQDNQCKLFGDGTNVRNNIAPDIVAVGETFQHEMDFVSGSGTESQLQIIDRVGEWQFAEAKALSDNAGFWANELKQSSTNPVGKRIRWKLSRSSESTWLVSGYSNVLTQEFKDAVVLRGDSTLETWNYVANSIPKGELFFDNWRSWKSLWNEPMFLFGELQSVNDFNEQSSWPTIKPDIVAFGVDINSSSPNNKFAVLSGTSMSAPHVAGAAALVLNANKNLTPLQVKEWLESKAIDLGEIGKDVDFGSGLLNVSNLSDLNSISPPDNNSPIDQNNPIDLNFSYFTLDVPNAIFKGQQTQIVLSKKSVNIEGINVQSETSIDSTAKFIVLDSFGNVVEKYFDGPKELDLVNSETFSFNWIPEETGKYYIRATVIEEGTELISQDSTELKPFTFENTVNVTVPESVSISTTIIPESIQKGSNAIFSLTASNNAGNAVKAFAEFRLIKDVTIIDSIVSEQKEIGAKSGTVFNASKNLVDVSGGDYNVLAVLSYEDKTVSTKGHTTILTPNESLFNSLNLPSTIQSDENLSFDFEYKNNGGFAITPFFTAKILDSDNNIVGIVFIDGNELQSNSSKTFNGIWPVKIVLGTYKLKLNASYENVSNEIEKNFQVIDSIAPEIGETVIAGEAFAGYSQSITVSIKDNIGVGNASLIVLKPDNSANEIEMNFLLNGTKTDGKWVATTYDTMLSGNYSIKAKACDSSNNCSEKNIASIALASEPANCFLVGKKILIVEDNNGLSLGIDSSSKWIESLLKSNDYCTAFIETRQSSEIPLNYFNKFDSVIWNSGSNLNALSQQNAQNLAAFLESGKKAIISGDEISFNHSFGDIAQKALHAELDSDLQLSESSAISTKTHSITNGISSIEIDRSISPYPDKVNPIIETPLQQNGFGISNIVPTSYGESAAVWQTGGNAIIAYGAQNYSTVFFAFSLNAITNESTKNTLLLNSMNWIQSEKDSPPIIDSFNPTESVVIMKENESMDFNITASDPDNDSIIIPWFEDGVERMFNSNGYAFETDYNSAGDHNITAIVTSNGYAVQKEWLVKVENVNRKPKILDYNPKQNRQVVQGEKIDFNITAIDEDNDLLKYEWKLNGIAKSFDKNFLFETNYSSAGEYDLNAIVSDDSNNAFANWHIIVLNSNQIPIIQNISDINVAEGEIVKIDVNAIDLDGDNLAYYIDSNKFSQNNNSFTWQTGFNDGGTYNFTVKASDGNLEATSVAKVNVFDSDRIPEIKSFEPLENPIITEGQPQTFSINAIDPDNDPLTINWFKNNQIAKNNSSEFSFETDFNSAGDYNITAIAIANNKAVQKEWKIKVNNVNRPPEIAPMVVPYVKEGEIAVIQVNASDPDNDKLIYSIDSNKFTRNENIFSWNTKTGDAGTYNFNIIISDGNVSITITATIVVSKINSPPTIEPIKDMNANEGELVTVSFQVSDPDNDQLTITIDSNKFAKNSKNFTWQTTFNDAGIYDFKIAVSDGNFTASQSFKVTVTNVNRVPKIDGFSPANNNSTINEGESQTFSITKSDPDGDNLSVKWLVNENEKTTNTDSYTFNSDYNSAGNYTVKVLISDSNLETSKEWILTVKDIPIACYSNSGCGIDSNVGIPFCFNSNVVIQFKKFYCNNPGTPAAICASDSNNILIEQCHYGCENGKCKENTPPKIVNTPGIGFSEDWNKITQVADLWQIFEDAEDSDDKLQFTITSQTNIELIKCDINQNRQLYCNPPTPNKNGDTIVSIQAKDTGYLTAIWNLAINVSPTNDIPTIDSFEPSNHNPIIFEGESINFKITKSDIDGDLLTVNWKIDGNTAAENTDSYNFDSTNKIPKEYYITVTVSDGKKIAIEQWYLLVRQKNTPSTFASQLYGLTEDGGVSGNLLDLWQFTFDREDSDDKLNFSLKNQTNVELINCKIESNRYLNCTSPAINKNGDNNIAIQVTDTGSLNTEGLITIRVYPSPDPPTIDSFNPSNNPTVKQGEQQLFTITKSDIDSNNLTVKWKMNNQLVLENQDSYTYNADYTSTGTHLIQVFVYDEWVIPAKHEWILTVEKNNRMPTIDTYSPTNNTPIINEGESQTFSITKSDPDGDNLSVKWLVNENEKTTNTDSYTFNSDYNSSGTYSIKAIVSDGSLEASNLWNLTVKDITIICQTNADCGTDSFVEQPFCFDKNINQNFTTYNCINAGTPSSYCKIETKPKSIEQCQFGCENAKCIQNTAPIADREIPNFSINEDESFNNEIDLWLNFSDAESADNQLEYSITNQTNNALTNCLVKENRFIECSKPSNNSNGSTEVTVQAKDSENLTANQVFKLTVLPVNDAPTIDSFEPLDQNLNLLVGEKVTVKVTKSDVDADYLIIRWFVDGNPAREGYDDFTIDSAWYTVGNHVLKVTVTDGTETILHEWFFKVQYPNRTPTITAFSPSNGPIINETQSVNFTINAVDLDGDIISYSWNLDGQSVGTNGNSYNYTAPIGSKGNHSLIVIVSDGTLQAQQSWPITVNEAVYEFDYTITAAGTETWNAIHNEEIVQQGNGSKTFTMQADSTINFYGNINGTWKYFGSLNAKKGDLIKIELNRGTAKVYKNNKLIAKKSNLKLTAVKATYSWNETKTETVNSSETKHSTITSSDGIKELGTIPLLTPQQGGTITSATYNISDNSTEVNTWIEENNAYASIATAKSMKTTLTIANNSIAQSNTKPFENIVDLETQNSEDSEIPENIQPTETIENGNKTNSNPQSEAGKTDSIESNSNASNNSNIPLIKQETTSTITDLTKKPAQSEKEIPKTPPNINSSAMERILRNRNKK